MTGWAVRPGLHARSLPGATVVVAPDCGTPVVLEGTAEDLWRLLRAPIAIDELTAELARRYDADPAVVDADVRAAVDDLAARGLVVER